MTSASEITRADLPTRVRTDRFGDTWRVYTGPDARRLRRQLERAAEAALAAYDADPSPDNRAAFVALVRAGEPS